MKTKLWIGKFRGCTEFAIPPYRASKIAYGTMSYWLDAKPEEFDLEFEIRFVDRDETESGRPYTLVGCNWVRAEIIPESIRAPKEAYVGGTLHPRLIEAILRWIRQLSTESIQEIHFENRVNEQRSLYGEYIISCHDSSVCTVKTHGNLEIELVPHEECRVTQDRHGGWWIVVKNSEGWARLPFTGEKNSFYSGSRVEAKAGESLWFDGRENVLEGLRPRRTNRCGSTGGEICSGRKAKIRIY